MRLPEWRTVPSVGVQQAGGHVEQGALSAAAWADDGDEGTLRDGERNAVEDAQLSSSAGLAEILPDILEFEHRRTLVGCVERLRLAERRRRGHSINPFATSSKAQALADAFARAFLQHGVAERDVGQCQPAMPEQIGLVVALAARA